MEVDDAAGAGEDMAAAAALASCIQSGAAVGEEVRSLELPGSCGVEYAAVMLIQEA
jgi:hypothetical protein